MQLHVLTTTSIIMKVISSCELDSLATHSVLHNYDMYKYLYAQHTLCTAFEGVAIVLNWVYLLTVQKAIYYVYWELISQNKSLHEVKKPVTIDFGQHNINMHCLSNMEEKFIFCPCSKSHYHEFGGAFNFNRYTTVALVSRGNPSCTDVGIRT